MAKRKLRSEAGASITFALLIFLVCAVVSSVVLVAATAASGRISNQAEVDQRYYSVTSAAEALKGMLDGAEISINQTSENTETVSYDADGNVTNSSNSLIIEEPTIPGTFGNEEISDFTPDSIQEYAAKSYGVSISYTNKEDTAVTIPTLLLKVISEGDKPEDVSLTEEVNPATGDITLTVGNQYKLQLFFKAAISTEVAKPNVEIETTPSSLGGSTVVTTTKTDTIYTLKWTFSDLKTIAA